MAALHQMGIAENPLAAKVRFFHYLKSAFQVSFQQKLAADRLFYGTIRESGYAAVVLAIITHGLWLTSLYEVVFGDPTSRAIVIDFVWISSYAAVFIFLNWNRALAAFLLPARWCAGLASAFAGMIAAAGAPVIRRAGWTLSTHSA